MKDINALKSRISLLNIKYREGNPEATDQQYDDLLDELKNCISANDYDLFVRTLHEKSGKVKHPWIMGSLEKIKAEEPENVKKFILNNVSGYMSVSAKVDGISCRLHYERGKLISASTRGDGYEGQDLTDKIKHVKFIPEKIDHKDPIDIRGELVILKNDFDEYFADRFANNRNATAGIMNKKEYDPEDISHVSFVCYTILGPDFTKKRQFELLIEFGFNVAWNIILPKNEATKDNIVDELFKYAQQDLPYDTDGLVMSDEEYVNEEEYYPTKQAAFKINQESAETKLIDIIWEGPNKTGKMSPIGLLEPVNLKGAMICKASLYNCDFIEKMGLKLGQTVRILRSGDVIPKLVEVVKTDNNCVEISYPDICPSCGEKLVRKGVDIICPNDKCSNQTLKQVSLFIKNMDVEYTSTKSLQNLEIDTIDKLLVWKPNPKYKSQMKLESEIVNKIFSKSQRDIFINLPFNGVGSTIAGKMWDENGLDRLRKWKGSVAPLECPIGVGDLIMSKFTESLVENLRLLDKIVSDPRYHYVQNDQQKIDTTKNGMSLCFTGSLNTMSRTEASEKAEKMGYEIKGGVSRGLTYLVTNDKNSGSSKNVKAAKLGIKIIDEQEFLRLISNDTSSDLIDL